MGPINDGATNVRLCNKIGFITETLFTSLCKQMAIVCSLFTLQWNIQNNNVELICIESNYKIVFPYNFTVNSKRKNFAIVHRKVEKITFSLLCFNTQCHSCSLDTQPRFFFRPK